jgi:MerR family transcriptional regulator, light-induced transcriptional regulator
MSEPIGLRIGELSRRVGVSVDVLRAWERRYGLLSPRRSPGGQRLYTEQDEDRLRRMRDHVNRGYAPQIAARMVLAGDAIEPAAGTAALATALSRALEAYDDGTANDLLDELLSRFSPAAVVTGVVLPLLREIGLRWERAEITVAQEHFASGLLGGRLRGLARGWDRGLGPHALLATPGGEAHDLGLLCFAVLLRERGWRVSYLGADVPLAALDDAVDALTPDLTVLAAVRPEPFVVNVEGLRRLAGHRPMAVGGRGATEAIAGRLGARRLADDPVAAADEAVLALS